MEKLGGGATRFRYPRSPPSSERILRILDPPQPSSPSPPLELSEHEIFSTPSGGSSPSPTYRNLLPSPNRSSTNLSRSSQNGILAALNDNIKNRSRSGSDVRPVFNHKASTSASLSSSSSTSPATSASSRMLIPKRPPPPPERVQIFHQSAPVNVPMIPAALQRRAMELEDIVSEEDEEEDNGIYMPPHEVVASRPRPILSCSVLEGDGRTLKGRDLRQVRNAIWRRTGFID